MARITQLKLGRHQKTILQILNEEIYDGLPGLSVTTLSWTAAQKLEKEPGNYIAHSLRKKGYTLTPRWRATFSRCLKRLEDRGLIIRTKTPTSERTHRITLTPEGRECSHTAEPPTLNKDKPPSMDGDEAW